MGFRNSVPYVQRQLGLTLAEFKHFYRAYIDDIVPASVTLDEYVDHLHQVFDKLEDMNITLEPKKAFIGYPSIVLLGQRVDGLGLTTTDEKLAAIREVRLKDNQGLLRTPVDPTPSKRQAFGTLQKGFDNPKFLRHHGPGCQLYIDLDSSKEFGHGAMIYHLKATYKHIDIQKARKNSG
ncbi:hypothetical protein NYO67_10467 [Aspergillus flavus]|nr:hypothetical protein NYO67_10467 [Aspergillus flavus]